MANRVRPLANHIPRLGEGDERSDAAQCPSDGGGGGAEKSINGSSERFWLHICIQIKVSTSIEAGSPAYICTPTPRHLATSLREIIGPRSNPLPSHVHYRHLALRALVSQETSRKKDDTVPVLVPNLARARYAALHTAYIQTLMTLTPRPWERAAGQEKESACCPFLQKDKRKGCFGGQLGLGACSPARSRPGPSGASPPLPVRWTTLDDQKGRGAKGSRSSTGRRS